MAKGLKLAALILALALARLVPGYAKEKQHAPLPKQLMTAQTVYIENYATADMVDNAYRELVKWGRFKVITDRNQADLILSLSINPELRIAKGTGRTHNYAQPEVLDPQTRESLYTDVQKNAASAVRELRKRIEQQEKHPRATQAE